MSFGQPLLLLALLAVPLALGAYARIQRRRMRYAVRFTNLDVLARSAEGSRPWRRYIPPALFALALAALAVALARPRVAAAVSREEATVVLAIDNSGSMLADDVKPTRLGAAQQAVGLFLDKLPKRFRVGVVSFASEAQVVAPPTQDRELVRQAVGFLAPGRGTAIGDAIARAVQAGRAAVGGAGPDAVEEGAASGSEAANRLVAILLLSDGAQTRGVLQPLEGAQRAKAAGIRVYTVALGTPEGILELSFGGFTRRIPVPPDPDTLRAIAETTGGDFYDAGDARELRAVYAKLSSRVGHRPGKREVTFAFLAAGALFLVSGSILSSLWFSRIP